MAKNEKNFLVGLDIGTTKVVALVAEIDADADVALDLVGDFALEMWKNLSHFSFHDLLEIAPKQLNLN